jgi:hypothetical protein
MAATWRGKGQDTKSGTPELRSMWSPNARSQGCSLVCALCHVDVCFLHEAFNVSLLEYAKERPIAHRFLHLLSSQYRPGFAESAATHWQPKPQA